METALIVVGFALIGAALLQFAFWTGRLVRLGQVERRRFEAELMMLKAQLDAITARRKSESPFEGMAENSSGQFEQTDSPTNKDAALPGKNAWKGYRKFRVAKLEAETANATSVYLQPVESFELPTYKPGQHLTVRLNIPGHKKPVVRCYTLSDAPGQNYYRLTIKRALVPASAPEIPPGVVSSFVNDKISEGEIIEVKPPSGKFWLADGESPIVLLAGGIGITPMMSIIQHLAATQSRRQCLLAYGARNGADVTFGQHLASLTKVLPNIHVINCFSDPQDSDRANEDFHVRGYVSAELLQRILPNNEFDFYLCGPPPFMNSLYEGLVDWGVPDSRIRFEAFGPATIKRRRQGPTDDSNETREEPQAGSCSKVNLAQTGKQLDWTNPDHTLLELCEENGIDIDSGCRAGNCGTCETRLVSGSVCYEEDADCSAGYVLPCIAKPNGPIEIDA